jgi:hypothetical protein
MDRIPHVVALRKCMFDLERDGRHLVKVVIQNVLNYSTRKSRIQYQSILPVLVRSGKKLFFNERVSLYRVNDGKGCKVSKFG